MLEWLVVIGLVLFGLGLIIIEIIFIPGTTFVGLLGLVLTGFGVFLSFQNFGSAIGLIVLVSSSITAVIFVIYGLKSGVWKKFALKDSIKSKFNEEYKHNLWIGDTGTTISTLKPFGKAEFDNKIFEVKTNGNYIDSDTKIKIIKIQDNKIIVEPINE